MRVEIMQQPPEPPPLPFMEAHHINPLSDEDEAAVFAVDRRNGEVLAWPSRQAAREQAPVYGVEDDAERPYLVKRHVLGIDPARDPVVYVEKDARC